MTVRLGDRGVGCVLLDIEGTTTPLSFVHDVLFPYARERLAGFVRDGWSTPALRDIATGLRVEHAADVAGGLQPPAWRATTEDDAIASTAAYCDWLMDRDRKSRALKQLQGLIWDRGYDRGDLHGLVFPDVPPAFRRWRAAGRTIAIYSSGSELAQRRLFATTEHGDLTPQIARFFDTAIGAKKESASYSRIAEALGRRPADVCFVSDVVAELTAARDAGLEVRLAVRPGNLPQDGGDGFPRVVTLDDV